MRHRKRTAKLGRTGQHRNAMLANLVCSLIKHKRVTTTLARAKAARSVAEQILTLGKAGTIHARRLAAARLRHQARTLHRSKTEREAWRKGEDVVRILFEELAPSFQQRQTPRSGRFWNGWILLRRRPNRRPRGPGRKRPRQTSKRIVLLLGGPFARTGLFVGSAGSRPSVAAKPSARTDCPENSPRFCRLA